MTMNDLVKVLFVFVLMVASGLALASQQSVAFLFLAAIACLAAWHWFFKRGNAMGG